MEKAFIVGKESKYYKDIQRYIEYGKQQSKFVNKFFEEKGIKTNEYYVRGDGFVNCHFKEYDKGEIRLAIIPEPEDEKFEKVLTMPDKHGMRYFRKNSNIAKEFAQKCVDEEVIINLYAPRINDYFKSLEYGMYGCGYRRFEYKDVMYIKIESDYLKNDDIPEGFAEIKLSEYYKTLEEFEKDKGDK